MKNFINIFLIKPSDFRNLISESTNTSISRERYIDLIKVVSIMAVIISTHYFLKFESSGYEVLIKNESTSNLDQELTENVIAGLQGYCGKLVILIAHQVVKGKFDFIIKL